MSGTRSILPTPSEMIAHLDRFVRGQTRAKQDIAVAVYNHYLSQAWRDRHGKDLGRYHILMIGPTGVGKTLLVKTLADFLGVPVGFTSAAGLVEAGYKGNSVETIVRGLLERAGGDPKKAEKGIIFIDEVDKIRRCDTAERDVSGEGVQNALLTMLDGRVSEGNEGQSHSAVDTGRILFICTGAFVGLRDIVEARVKRTRSLPFGFRPRANEDVEKIPNNPIYEALCQAETRDLVDFGMIPEFIGRFATVAVLHELSREDLRAIVSDRTESSALERATMLAKLHGIELVLSDDALEAIVDEAMALGTGARGLHRLIGRALDSVDYRWPELAAEGVHRVVIDRASIASGGEPQCVKGVLTIDRLDTQLRAEALAILPPQPRGTASKKQGLGRPVEGNGAQGPTEAGDTRYLTDTIGWSAEQLRASIDAIKVEHLAWIETTGPAKTWWDEFELANETKLTLVHRLVEELRNRKATIGEFYLACTYSNTDDILANLCYLDYMHLKRDAMRRKQKK